MTEFIPKYLIDKDKDKDAVIRLNYQNFVEYTNFNLTFWFNDGDMEENQDYYSYNSVVLNVRRDPNSYTERLIYNWEASKFFELLDEGMIEIFPKQYIKRINKMLKNKVITREYKHHVIPHRPAPKREG